MTESTPTRPTRLTPEMALRAAMKLAESLLKDSLIEGDVAEAAADIAKHAHLYMGGYELAKTLDDSAYWDCNLETAEALDGWSHLAGEEIKAAQKEWAEANNIQPPFPVGARVIARWGGEDHPGTIDEICSFDVARYCVKRDGETSTRCMVVNFEDVRAVEEAKPTLADFEHAARAAGWTATCDNEFTDGTEIVGSIGPSDPDGGWPTLCDAMGIAVTAGQAEGRSNG